MFKSNVEIMIGRAHSARYTEILTVQNVLLVTLLTHGCISFVCNSHTYTFICTVNINSLCIFNNLSFHLLKRQKFLLPFHLPTITMYVHYAHYF